MTMIEFITVGVLSVCLGMYLYEFTKKIKLKLLPIFKKITCKHFYKLKKGSINIYECDNCNKVKTI